MARSFRDICATWNIMIIIKILIQHVVRSSISRTILRFEELSKTISNVSSILSSNYNIFPVLMVTSDEYQIEDIINLSPNWGRLGPFIISLFIAIGFASPDNQLYVLPDVHLDDYLLAKICEKMTLAGQPARHPPSRPPSRPVFWWKPAGARDIRWSFYSNLVK